MKRRRGTMAAASTDFEISTDRRSLESSEEEPALLK
jgi:hypothetical protein